MKSRNFSKIECVGCGALVENLAGQPHQYIGASQGCWDLYGLILAKEYGEYNYPQLTHRLTVDTYAVQHPGEPNRQSIQSVNVHLINLYLILVKGCDGKTTTRRMSEILAKELEFEWLEPPVFNSQLTVVDVLAATNEEEHVQRVREWAKSVWKCWFAKHRLKIEQLANKNI